MAVSNPKTQLLQSIPIQLQIMPSVGPSMEQIYLKQEEQQLKERIQEIMESLPVEPLNLEETDSSVEENPVSP